MRACVGLVSCVIAKLWLASLIPDSDGNELESGGGGRPGAREAIFRRSAILYQAAGNVDFYPQRSSASSSASGRSVYTKYRTKQTTKLGSCGDHDPYGMYVRTSFVDQSSHDRKLNTQLSQALTADIFRFEDISHDRTIRSWQSLCRLFSLMIERLILRMRWK